MQGSIVHNTDLQMCTRKLPRDWSCRLVKSMELVIIVVTEGSCMKSHLAQQWGPCMHVMVLKLLVTPQASANLRCSRHAYHGDETDKCSGQPARADSSLPPSGVQII